MMWELKDKVLKSDCRLLYCKQNIILPVLQYEFSCNFFRVFAKEFQPHQSNFLFIEERNTFYDNNYVIRIEYDSHYKCVLVKYSCPFAKLFLTKTSDKICAEIKFFRDVYDSYFAEQRLPIYETKFLGKTVYLEKNFENFNEICEYYNYKEAFKNAVILGSILTNKYDIEYYRRESKILDFLSYYKHNFSIERNDKLTFKLLNIYQYQICPMEIHDYFLITLYNMVNGNEVALSSD